MDMCDLGGCVFGSFGWTKGGSHKRKLTELNG